METNTYIQVACPPGFDRWYLVVTQGGECTPIPITKKVAERLIENGCSTEG
jgi:hypothetical protein